LRFVAFFARFAGAGRGAAFFFAFLALRFAGARREGEARFFAVLRLAFFADAFFLVLRAILVSLE
jgi:hypothetical protein